MQPLLRKRDAEARARAAESAPNGLARFRRRARSQSQKYRTLVASAAQIDLTDRDAAQRLRALRARSAWQIDAWEYRRRLGELRYATAYLGNSVMRLKLYAGVFIDDNTEPILVTDPTSGIPADLATAAQEIIEDLGNGSPLGVATLMKKLTENFEVAGECYLIGQMDPITRQSVFSIRSVSEVIQDASGRYGIRDDPSVSDTGMTTGGTGKETGVEWLDPDLSFAVRLWWPDPEWSKLADSPVRAVMDTLDELSLLSLDVRATARSRLANNGILLVPEGLSVVRANSAAAAVDPVTGQPTEDDEEVDEFLEELMETATAALTNEGSAAAAVPIIMRGPAEAFAAMKHLILARPADNRNSAQRIELIGRLATGIDLPADVLTGKADLNHWSAWQIDDDSFRHHVEPITQVMVDSLTAGYLWPFLDAEGQWDPADIRKIVIWYDPTALVTHPDRSGDAKDAFDRGAIGRKALRDYLGMPDSDAPDKFDEILYTLTKARGVDPTLLTALLKAISTQTDVVIPEVPAQPDPKVPGGSDGQPPPAPTNPDDPARNQPGPPATPSVPPQVTPAAGASVDDIRVRLFSAKIDAVLAAALQLPLETRRAIIAASAPRPTTKEKRLSKKLMDVDRRTRDRLQAASSMALRRMMERAGARVISKSRKSGAASIRGRFASMPTWQIPMHITRAELAALGLDQQRFIDDSLGDLQDTYNEEIESGIDGAASVVAELTGRSKSDVLAETRARFDTGKDKGWQQLQSALTAQARDLVPNLTDDDLGADDANQDDEVDGSSLNVPMGAVRAAVALAGGFGTSYSSSGLNGNRPVDSSEYMGGIANGDTFADFLSGAGLNITSYEWTHGPSDNPFEPHLDLDGYTFTDFTDDGLAVEGDFPDTGYYTPGDHDGCSCDLTVIWSSAANAGPSDDSGSDGDADVGDDDDADALQPA